MDEVHVLFEEWTQARVLLEEWTQPRSRYDELCSVLGDLRKEPLFIVFLSTASKLSQIAPPVDNTNSDRMKSESIILPSPFTELPFDLFAEGIVQEGVLDRRSVGSFSFIVKFGRAM